MCEEQEEDALAFSAKESGYSPRHTGEANGSLAKPEAEVLQLRPLLRCQRAAHPHSRVVPASPSRQAEG